MQEEEQNLPIPNLVAVIYYGPYEVCGIVRHRSQRIFGLRGFFSDFDLFSSWVIGNIPEINFTSLKFEEVTFAAFIPDRLRKAGFNVKIKRWHLYDRCTVYYEDEDIFTCRLTVLQYPFMKDPVADELFVIAQNIQSSYLEYMSCLGITLPPRTPSETDYDYNRFKKPLGLIYTGSTSSHQYLVKLIHLMNLIGKQNLISSKFNEKEID